MERHILIDERHARADRLKALPYVSQFPNLIFRMLSALLLHCCPLGQVRGLNQIHDCIVYIMSIYIVDVARGDHGLRSEHLISALRVL